MRPTRAALLPVLLLLALTGRAAAQAPAPAAPMPPMPAAPPPGPGRDAMARGMAVMQRAMQSAPVTGDPDRDFVAMMIPHHQGAIAMAANELKYGKDPQIRRLASDIIAAQRMEIAAMRTWLAKQPPR